MVAGPVILRLAGWTCGFLAYAWAAGGSLYGKGAPGAEARGHTWPCPALTELIPPQAPVAFEHGAFDLAGVKFETLKEVSAL